MNKKIAAIISVILIAIIGVFSIGMKKENNTAKNEGNKVETVTVTDANGEKVELNKGSSIWLWGSRYIKKLRSRNNWIT